MRGKEVGGHVDRGEVARKDMLMVVVGGREEERTKFVFCL